MDTHLIPTAPQQQEACLRSAWACLCVGPGWGGAPLSLCRVRGAAGHAPQMNYANKSLIGAMIVAGWDPVEGGQVPRLRPLALRMRSCPARRRPACRVHIQSLSCCPQCRSAACTACTLPAIAIDFRVFAPPPLRQQSVLLWRSAGWTYRIAFRGNIPCDGGGAASGLGGGRRCGGAPSGARWCGRGGPPTGRGPPISGASWTPSSGAPPAARPRTAGTQAGRGRRREPW